MERGLPQRLMRGVALAGFVLKPSALELPDDVRGRVTELLDRLRATMTN